MYENGKTRPVKTTPGMGLKEIKWGGERGQKKMMKGSEFNYDIL
jgi:hypothetical protein